MSENLFKVDTLQIDPLTLTGYIIATEMIDSKSHFFKWFSSMDFYQMNPKFIPGQQQKMPLIKLLIRILLYYKGTTIRNSS